MWSEVVFLWTFSCIVFSQFFDCQNDPTSDPEEGPADELQFTWLGVLQYIHIQRGNPHFFRVPRVVVITRQFALSTAVDAAQVPGGYALGNIVLGEYERDEEECGVTVEDVAAGARCDPAMMLVPIADVLLHPEYKNFGAQNSVALLKLITQIKSRYMLPACLPFKDFVMDADGTPTMVQFYHIDYTTAVPRDLYNEEKEVTLISLLPREVCYLYDTPDNSTKFVMKRMACTTGCDFYSGAPSVVHETTGHWTLVALSEGSAPCPDPLVPRAPPPPPRHLLLHQYVPWITAAISGTPVGSFVRDDPFGYMVARTSSKYDRTRFGWVGHWWMGGIRCYDRGAMADDIFRFYHEVFQVNPRVQTNLTYYLEIDSAYDSVVVCVKLGMPNAIGQPRVWGLHTSNVKVRIPVIRLKKKYKFEVEAWAHGRKHEEGRRAGEEDEASDEVINVEETNNTRPLV